MEINSEIIRILKEYKIDKDGGLLYLLGIYHNLNVDKIAPEALVKQMNLTKIVERDYSKFPVVITWNVPLFVGQEVGWDWVQTEYNELWKKYPSRKASNPDVTKRMKEWFSKHPIYRKEDVMKATRAYHATVREERYCKGSLLFIEESEDKDRNRKVSMLLGWCEKVRDSGNSTTFKGTLIT